MANLNVSGDGGNSTVKTGCSNVIPHFKDRIKSRKDVNKIKIGLPKWNCDPKRLRMGEIIIFKLCLWLMKRLGLPFCVGV